MAHDITIFQPFHRPTFPPDLMTCTCGEAGTLVLTAITVDHHHIMTCLACESWRAWCVPKRFTEARARHAASALSLPPTEGQLAYLERHGYRGLRPQTMLEAEELMREVYTKRVGPQRVAEPHAACSTRRRCK